MEGEHVKLEIVNENNKDADKHLDNEVERIFGNPPVHKPVSNNNNILNSERDHYNTHNDNNNGSEMDPSPSSQPLLDPNRDKLPPLAAPTNLPVPPTANVTNKPEITICGPETDELDGDLPKDAITHFSASIDHDLVNSDKKPDGSHQDSSEHDGTEADTLEEHHLTRTHSFTDGKLPWEHDEPDYPYDLNGVPGMSLDDRGMSPIPGFIPDVNTYQQKKNLAQGMMDLALLSANANQLRYVLESSTTHSYYYSSLIFLSLSIIFQVLVGVGLIMNSRYDVNKHKEICKADKINNLTVLGVFLITIVNVFITSFSVPASVATNMSQVAQATQVAQTQL